MKKLLALVLALVMSMSLVTISNAAFKDADKIDYKEAVDVMNAVGVFVGDEKGNFNAKDNLTREQAAKIIAYLELGEKAADALVGSATFTDVAATRWSAGFVSYCAQAGVVSGYDGKFDPAGQLTALQFGKMLLVEIGYDAKAAGMVGTDWAINTSKLLATTGLMDKIDGSVNQVLTREKAAQMTLNALKTPTVEYATKGSNITVNGAEINFGASVPTYVTNTIAKYQTISKDKLTNSDDYTIELGEKLFKKLVLSDTSDAFGRPTRTWTFENKKVGEYVKDADLEYTKDVKYKGVYSDLGLTKTATTTEYYVDGLQKTNVAITKNGDTKFGAKGALTQVWYDDENNTAIVTTINTYVAKVNSVTKATSNDDRYVTLAPVYSTSMNDLVKTFDTEDFEAKDLVTFTMAYNTDTLKYDIQSVKALEKSATGSLTKYAGTNIDNAGAYFIVGSEKYEYATKAKVAGSSSDADTVSAVFKIENDLDVYLDQYGYAIYVDGVETVKEYAVVIATGVVNQYGTGANGATLLLADGTVKTANIKWATGTNEGAGASHSRGTVVSGAGRVNFLGDLVTYTVEKDGTYKLTAADAKAAGTSTSKYYSTAVVYDGTEITNGKSYMTIKKPSSAPSDVDHTYATEKTLFFVKTGTQSDDTKWSYQVYTGYSAVPSISDESGANVTGVTYVKNEYNQVLAVFIDCDHVKGFDAKATFISRPSDPYVYTDKTGLNKGYALLPAVIDGEITEIAVDYTTMLASGKAMEHANTYLFDIVNKNADGSMTDTSTASPSESQTYAADGSKFELATGTVATNTSKKVVGFGASNTIYWAYTDATEVYYISSDYKTITKGDVESIGTDADDAVTYSIDSNTKTLKKVFIKVNDPSSLYSITLPAGLEVWNGSKYVSGTLTDIAKNTTMYVHAKDITKAPVLAGVTTTGSIEVADDAYGRIAGASIISFAMPARNLTASEFSIVAKDYSVAIDDVVAGSAAGTIEVTSVESDDLAALCSGTSVTVTAKVEKSASGTGAWLVVSGTSYNNGVISGVASTTSADGYRVTLTYKVGSKTVATVTSAGYSLTIA